MEKILLLLAITLSHGANLYAQSTTLNIEIRDKGTGQIVPARVEVVDDKGNYFVAEDALLVGGDCDMSDEGASLTDLKSTLKSFTDRIQNAYSNSTQFYSSGISKILLPKGIYTLSIFKGPEYNISHDTINFDGKTKTHAVELSRWINMPENGWYSSDDHLHIPRPVKELNPYISKMMQAEDIHVANLLQMGKLANFSIAKQLAHGPEGIYQVGNYILAAGQENPRSHFLGHTITLGAKKAINNPEKYLIYKYVWEEAVRQGGINGFAHANQQEGNYLALSAHDGLAVILPHNLTHFMEVLQFNEGNYDLWYDVLNLGFKVAPTAGTDYPCGGSNIPGRERFYTKLGEGLNYDSWIHGVRKGRTFVTNGPMIEFNVGNKDIGGETSLTKADSIKVVGRVIVNPNTDFIDIVEIIHNGNVIKRISGLDGQREVKFDFKVLVKNNSWFAMRGYGYKKSELNKLFERTDPLFFSWGSNSTFCHSAAIYVTLPNTENPEKAKVASLWLNRLTDMENLLSEKNIDLLHERTDSQSFHAVSKKVLMENRLELLQEIAESKKFFSDFLVSK